MFCFRLFAKGVAATVSDITIGQFFPGKSFIHKLDARVKTVIVFISLIFTLVCHNFYSLALITAFAIFVYTLSRLSPRLLLKSLKPIIPIILLTSVLLLFFNKNGTALVEFGKLAITDNGIYVAIFIAVRILVLIVISSLLTYTTSPTQLTDAIESLLSPLRVFKIDVHTFSMLMTIALRFIPILVDEIDRIMSAQKARGADFESGNIIERIKALFPIFIPLFVSSLNRAGELADAMSARCYAGGEGRTKFKVMKAGRRDAVSIVFTVLLAGGLIALNIIFGKLV